MAQSITTGMEISPQKTKSLSYTPFGEQLNSIKTSGFTYNGEYFDGATSMLNLRARQYEPTMNRFSQKDLLRGNSLYPLSQNRYGFVTNDPVNLIDPDGKIFKWAGKFIKDAVDSVKQGVVENSRRFNNMMKQPSIRSVTNYLTFGNTEAYIHRAETAAKAPTVKNFANNLLWGVPTVAEQEFNPDEPFSFDHFAKSFQIAFIVAAPFKAVAMNNVMYTPTTEGMIAYGDHYSAICSGNTTNIGTLEGEGSKNASEMKPNPNNTKIHQGQQDKHIAGTNNYKQELANNKPRSILVEDAQTLLDEFAGTGKRINNVKEWVNFDKVIGQFYDEKTGVYSDTTKGIIHYNTKNEAHIIPSNPAGDFSSFSNIK